MSFVTMMEGHLAWGDKPLLDNADLTVEAGQRIGLIGRNGTGKSSLLKVLAGIEKLDGGELHTQNGLHAVEVEHVTAKAGIDIGDTAIGMHVKFVQIPVRTSIKEIGSAHVTYLSSRPKLIGGERAIYKFENLNQQVDPLNPLA